LCARATIRRKLFQSEEKLIFCPCHLSMRVENEEEEEVVFIKSILCLNLTLVDSCENHYGVQFCQPLWQSTNAWAHDMFKLT